MNKYAQVKGGKIIYFYQTDLSIGDLTSIFSPKTFWVDVTDKECGLGWEVSYNSDCEMVLTAPPAPTTPTFEQLKAQKLTKFKTIRDTEEVKPISYQGYRFDYDSKARDRISAAIIALDVSKGQIEWTTADNTNVLVTADDLRGVIAAVAMRSNELHVKYRQLKEQVEACTTKEQLEKIEW